MRILIVEDNEIMMNVISHTLEEAGYKYVDKVKDGIKGLSMALDIDYDLIITPIHLKKLSGLNLIRSYRKNGGKAQILVLNIPLSNYIKKRLFDYEIVGLIQKPFLPSCLLSSVKRIEKKTFNEIEKNILRKIAVLIGEKFEFEDLKSNELLVLLQEKLVILKYLADKDLADKEETALILEESRPFLRKL